MARSCALATAVIAFTSDPVTLSLIVLCDVLACVSFVFTELAARLCIVKVCGMTAMSARAGSYALTERLACVLRLDTAAPTDVCAVETWAVMLSIAV